MSSDTQLPTIEQRPVSKHALESSTWPQESQRFHTSTLSPEQEAVREHFNHLNVVCAGSYEGCACGFNYGREYPEYETEEGHLVAARESVAELVRYIRESNVREIYCCWFDDEAKPILHYRTVTPEALMAADFVFQQQELLKITHR